MIAIDFGTTNSSVAVLSEGDVAPRLQSLELDFESYNVQVLPSVICECSSDKCNTKRDTYGHEALRHGYEMQHDTRLLQEMKLHFDRSTIEPATLLETKTLIALREDRSGALNPITKVQRVARYDGEVPLKPKDFVPGTASLVKEIIRRSKVSAEDRKDVVLGVPASFGGVGIRHLREAAKKGAFGESANYEGISLYSEPLAAARAYMEIATGNTLVLDYGGGTLDITVMRIKEPGKFDMNKDILGSSGFPEGGSEMDHHILRHSLSKGGERALEWFQEQPLPARLRIKRNVERAKIELSKEETVSVEFPGSTFKSITLNRPDISHALQPIMTRMASRVTQTVLRAVGSIENIDFVIMSGGTSLSAAVQNAVLAMFGHLSKEQFILPDPNDRADVESCMCAVAKGLALLRKDGFTPINVEDAR
jgi:molecular chaperone DnaK (HSP70)